MFLITHSGCWEKYLLGPLNKAGEVALGLDILPDAEVAGSLLEERVYHPLSFKFLDGKRSRGHLLAQLLTLKGVAPCIDHFVRCRCTRQDGNSNIQVYVSVTGPDRSEMTRSIHIRYLT